MAEKSDPQARIKTMNPETKYTLEELERDYKESTIQLNKIESKEKADKFNAAHYSTGAVAASFTSTTMVPRLTHEPAIVHEDEVRYERVKKKGVFFVKLMFKLKKCDFSGYVRLVTNLGPLNLELYCDTIPKTCENFLKHCKNGYYDGTKFHRSIRNFMVIFFANIFFCVNQFFVDRFKVVILPIQAEVVNRFGVKNLKMKSSRIYPIQDVEFYPWQIPVKTQMVHNCNDYKKIRKLFYQNLT